MPSLIFISQIICHKPSISFKYGRMASLVGLNRKAIIEIGLNNSFHSGKPDRIYPTHSGKESRRATKMNRIFETKIPHQFFSIENLNMS